MNELGSDDAGNGPWDGRCEDPSLVMFRKAVDYARGRGLPWENLPELRSENGVLHAFPLDGRKLRLTYGEGWEVESGYARLVDGLLATHRQRAEGDEIAEQMALRPTAKT